MLKAYNKCSAVYKTKNNIENFRFRITFRAINSSIKLPKFVCNDSRNLDVSNQETCRNGSSTDIIKSTIDDDTEELEITWQEKILSPTERELYSTIENCTTDRQKIYHNWILSDESPKKSKKKYKIFTYVSDDNFVYDEKLEFADEENKFTPKPKSVQSLQENMERMYVFADLEPDTLLLFIKWKSGDDMNTLIIYPDFNSYIDSPYFIEINTDCRYLYKYAIENISQDRCNFIVSPRDLISTKFSKLPLSTTQGLFDMPAKQKARVLFLLEIVKAEHFYYENLHIRYKIIHSDVIDLESGLLCGSTYSTVSMGGVWKFGHCFDLCFTVSAETILHHNIKIFFEIISIDSWLRERTEGYTSASFNFKPGLKKLVLQCYRIDHGFWHQVERFFIGGRKNFDFDKYKDNEKDGTTTNQGTDESVKEKFLNLYNLDSISTGNLVVQSRVVTQIFPNFTLQLFKKQGRTKGMSDLLRAYRSTKMRLEATANQ